VTHLSSTSNRAARDNVPFSVLFEITGRCNLDCQHCYLDIKHPPPERTTAEILATLDQLAEAGTFFLTISGGEVFLRKDLIPILQYARKLGFAVRLFTSGTRLTWPLAREIAKLNLVAVEMSLYGVNVVLKSPMLSEIQGEHMAFMALAKRVGAMAKLDPSVMARRDGERSPLGMRPEVKEIARAFRDLGLLKPGDPLPPPAHPDQAPCAIARRTARIGPEGKVYPCAAYPDAVGDLRERSFRDIWWGTPTPLLAKLRAFTFKDVGPGCGGCAKSGYCSRCIAVAVIEHGDMGAVQEGACRVTHARDLAVENGAPLPPGLAPDRRPRHRSLPIVAA
jgi:radical SAM protein with 4Fe4S-binding SPASM domain